MKLSTQLRLLSLLTVVSTAPSVPASQSVSCNVITPQGSVPNYPVALQQYSYCGGVLDVSVWVKNLNYNKVVQMYYADAAGRDTPLNIISLGWVKMAEGTDNSWEYWAAKAPVYIDGITKLINITYDALDVRQHYVQRLDLAVVPSGDPAPAPAPAPVPRIKPQGFSSDISDYLKVSSTAQPGISKKRMFDNISPRGAVRGLVTAAQSRADPDYWYHWIRDAALTMDLVVLLYEAASPSAKGFYEERLFWYAQASLDEQNDGSAFTGLGEPKFYLDTNKGYRGPWGRPQNDGPGARAITLIRFAEVYLKNGGSKDTAITKLWTPISRDLAYVADTWPNLSFDLWEEVSSHHFYNRMIHHRALLDGAAFARKLGFTNDASRFAAAAAQVYRSAQGFWNAQRGLVLYNYGPAIRDKTSFKDISVVLGVLHAHHKDGVYSYTSDEILASAYEIATSFLDIYSIAKTTHDSKGQPLGMPIGRYPEDVYDGTGTSRGNPWYLTTTAMAELFYNGVAEFTARGNITVTPATQKFWKYFAPAASVGVKQVYDARTPEFQQMIRALQGWGDSWMRTVRYWAPADGRFPEEYDRDDGRGVGAKDLTWSYAAFLTAGAARARATGDNEWLAKVADL